MPRMEVDDRGHPGWLCHLVEHVQVCLRVLMVRCGGSGEGNLLVKGMLRRVL